MRIAVSILLVVLSFVASPARAYVRATVDGVPDRPIFWENRTISIELASASSTDVTPAELRAALDRSLGTWTRAGDCTDVVLVDVGDALAATTSLDGGPPDHHNRVVVRESGWPAIVGPETLALTTVLYDRDTGAIVDADTDLNAVVHVFSTSDPPPAADDDVQNTLTHELGHTLGFAHSSDPDATMYVSAALAETSKRDLAADDLRAICETYPTGRPTPTTLPTPSAMPASCALVHGASDAPACVAVALSIALVRRRRRSRR